MGAGIFVCFSHSQHLEQCLAHCRYVIPIYRMEQMKGFREFSDGHYNFSFVGFFFCVLEKGVGVNVMNEFLISY